MPRHIIRPAPRSPKHDRFVKRLAEELKTPGTQPQPLILEEEVPATGSRHVHVIWDEWKKLPEEERAEVIVEAYREADGLAYAEQITIASGLTATEALALGLLPWKVEPIRDGAAAAESVQALLAEGKNTLLGSKRVAESGLRYARTEDAEEALKRLRHRLPNSDWAIVQDLGSNS